MGSVCSSSHDKETEYFGIPLYIIRKRESKLKGEYYPVGASVPFLLQDLTLALARSKLTPQPSPHQHHHHVGSGNDDNHNDDDDEDGDSRQPQQIQALTFPLDVDRIRIRDMMNQIRFITSSTKRVHFSMFAMMLSMDEMNASREELVYLFQHFLQKLPFPILKPSLLATFLDAIKADPNVQRDWNAAKHHAKGKPRDQDMLDRWNLLTQTQGVRAVGKVELSPGLLERIKTTILTEDAIESPIGEESDDDRVGSFSTFHWVLSTIDSVPGVFFPFEACIAMIEAMSVSAANKDDFALVTVVLLQMFCPQWVALHLRQVSALHVATSPHASSIPPGTSSSTTASSMQRSISATSSRGEGGASAGAPGGGLLSPLGGSSTTAPPTPHLRSEPTSRVNRTSSAPGGGGSGGVNVSTLTAGPNSLNASEMGGAGGGVASVSAINPSNLSDAHSATDVQSAAGVVDELSAPQGPFQNSQNTSAIAKSSVDGSHTTGSSSATDRTQERSHNNHNSQPQSHRNSHPHSHRHHNDHNDQQYSPQESNNNTPSKKIARRSSRQYDDDIDANNNNGDHNSENINEQSGKLPRSVAAGKELKSAMSAFIDGGLELDDSWVSGGTVSIGRSGEDGGGGSANYRTGTRRNNNNKNNAISTPLNERDGNVEEGGDDEPDQPEWPVRLRETRTIHTEINDKLRDAQRAFMLASDTSSSSASSGDKENKHATTRRHVDAVASSSPTINSVDHQKFQNVVALVDLLQRDNQQLRTELGGAMEDISDAFERLHSENVRLKTLVTNVNINKAFKERVQTVLTQMAESNLAVTEDITRTRHELRDLRETVLMNVEDRESVHREILQAKRETADVHLKWVEVERRVLDASTRVSALEHRVEDTNQRTEEVAAAVGSCVMDHGLLSKRLYSAGAVEAAYLSSTRPTF